MIESREMIHVRVRDEHVRHAHQFARRQHADVAKVEQHRAALVPEIDEESGVAERLVGQTRLEERTHEAMAPLASPLWKPRDELAQSGLGVVEDRRAVTDQE